MLSSMMTVSVTLTPRGALNSVEVGESRLEGFINFLNYRDDTGERHKHLTLKKNLRHVKGTGKVFEALKITKVKVRDQNRVGRDEKRSTAAHVLQGHAYNK